MNKQYRYFVGDFETTVYKGQVHTEVWASACVELNTEDVKIFHSIGEQFEYFKSLNCNIVCYYHNLKFDGCFWLAYLMAELGYEQAIEHHSNNELDIDFINPKNMKTNTFQYTISDMGQWYSIKIKTYKHIIELRDSLKLLPFSVKRIGDSFGTKHKKLNMQYTGFRYAGCEITDDEKKYIANDVLVVKEALEIMFQEGHNKSTIGACCLAEYKNLISKKYFQKLYPNVYDIPLDKDIYGQSNVGEYIRKSYKGGWCYLVRGKEKQLKYNGTTADVNSLYPSMMSSESGNKYPIGLPTFWQGNYIPDEALQEDKYYFIRIKTRFYLKKNYLPFIQIKNSIFYDSTECLDSSDIYDRKTGERFTHIQDDKGNLLDTRVILTLTMTDFELMKEHYNFVDFEILDGCYFDAQIGIFDEYIEKYKKLKIESKGALRELAKLFLNNLYGKMASNTNSSFKVAYLKEDKSIGFITIPKNDKKPGYIPVGSAITSYARNFTIRAAQQNYYGVDKAGFIYADTDSIHCDLSPEEIKGITVHPKNFCCWKLETSWDIGYFTRQKTYIEHVVAEDLQAIETPYYNVKCAGMPDKCKQLFIKSMTGYTPTKDDSYTQEELDFLSIKRTIQDFKVGLCVPGKLMPKRIRGGLLLVDTTYEMR